MKFLIYISSILLMPLLSQATPLLERELFNARNGETYVCQIHEDLQTELFHEGLSVGKFSTEFTTSSEKVKSWVAELQKSASQNRFSLTTKVIKNYIHRGFKNYSLYKNTTKMSFYQLAQHQSPSRGTKSTQWGSLEKQARGKSTLVQQLRGQVDEACKASLLKL